MFDDLFSVLGLEAAVLDEIIQERRDKCIAGTHGVNNILSPVRSLGVEVFAVVAGGAFAAAGSNYDFGAHAVCSLHLFFHFLAGHMAAGHENEVAVRTNSFHFAVFHMIQREVVGDFDALFCHVGQILLDECTVGGVHYVEGFDVFHISLGEAFVSQHTADGHLHGVGLAVGGTLEYAVVIDYFVAGKCIGCMVETAVRIVQTDLVHNFFHVICNVVITESTDECRLSAAQFGIHCDVQRLAAGVHETLGQVLVDHTVADTDNSCHKYHLIKILGSFIIVAGFFRCVNGRNALLFLWNDRFSAQKIVQHERLTGKWILWYNMENLQKEGVLLKRIAIAFLAIVLALVLVVCVCSQTNNIEGLWYDVSDATMYIFENRKIICDGQTVGQYELTEDSIILSLLTVSNNIELYAGTMDDVEVLSDSQDEVGVVYFCKGLDNAKEYIAKAEEAAEEAAREAARELARELNLPEAVVSYDSIVAGKYDGRIVAVEAIVDSVELFWIDGAHKFSFAYWSDNAGEYVYPNQEIKEIVFIEDFRPEIIALLEKIEEGDKVMLFIKPYYDSSFGILPNCFYGLEIIEKA